MLHAGYGVELDSVKAKYKVKEPKHDYGNFMILISYFI